jgi:hypothetical protein
VWNGLGPPLPPEARRRERDEEEKAAVASGKEVGRGGTERDERSAL